MKNFTNAVFIKDICDNMANDPLLSLFELDGKSFLMTWVDVEIENIWLIIEVVQASLVSFLAGHITLLEVERCSPAIFQCTGFIDHDCPPIWFEDIPDMWRALETSFYDESLTPTV